MRWRLGSATACSGALLALAGCGGGGESRLDADRAAELAARAEQVATQAAAGRTCAAARGAGSLQRELIDEVNAGHIPDTLQEELLSTAGELVARLPCPGRADRGAATVARELARRVRAASG